MTRDLRGMSPAQLDRLATEWLAEHDPRPKQRGDGWPPSEWSLSPVCAELDCDDEDALEIAATFAALSGGRLCVSLLAHVSDEHARGVLARRSYMQRARRDPETRRRWRAMERERRRLRAQQASEAALLAALRRAAEHERCRGSKQRRAHDPRQTVMPWAA